MSTILHLLCHNEGQPKWVPLEYAWLVISDEHERTRVEFTCQDCGDLNRQHVCGIDLDKLQHEGIKVIRERRPSTELEDRDRVGEEFEIEDLQELHELLDDDVAIDRWLKGWR